VRFLTSLPGILLLTVVFVFAVIAGVLSIRVDRATRPDRVLEASTVLASTFAKFEEVHFPAADGVDLAGWKIPGKPGHPAIVLCHDFGASKASLLNVAIPLQRAGFHLLAFDFRGHGQSGGARSSLGVLEKRDVLGAVDYLVRARDIDSRRLGILGVGMGAHAASLAALDRPALRVLVLDALYPDVSYPLVRRVYEGWPFGVEHLGFLPRALFHVMTGARSEERADEALPALGRRDLLLVAPADDSALAGAMERIYRAIPTEKDGTEGNLITLPATLGTGLYGDDLERYLARVCGFFESRLPTGRPEHSS